MDGTTKDDEHYDALQNYNLGRTIGVGTFAEVKYADDKRTGRSFAIKILNRRKMAAMGMEENARREIAILKSLTHRNIIRLYKDIHTCTYIYLVMEYCKNGELLDRISQKGMLMEDEARRFFQQIISAVDYCHTNKVVHRDLKPENILLGSNDTIKIADFELSNVMDEGHLLKTSCGSPNYAAPECVLQMYSGREVDVWSCGVILYALLCGTLPFDDDNVPNLFRKINGGIYILPSHLSALARDLISRMIVVDPTKRITITEIREHPWFH